MYQVSIDNFFFFRTLCSMMSSIDQNKPRLENNLGTNLVNNGLNVRSKKGGCHQFGN